jgi:hypothetical protein
MTGEMNYNRVAFVDFAIIDEVVENSVDYSGSCRRRISKTVDG